MHRRFPLLVVASAIAASACAGPARVAPDVRTRPAFSYEAGFHAAPAAPLEAQPAGVAGGRRAEIDVLVVALDAREAAILEGEARRGPSAWTTGRARLAPYLELARTDDERVITTPCLLAAEDRTQRVAVIEERSYVADFELHGDEHAIVADPVVRTFHTGLELAARATFRGDARVELALTLVDRGLPGGISEHERRLPGVPSPVILETPRLLTQRLATTVALAPDECLVLGWDEGGALARRRIALVSARPAHAPGTE